MVTWKKTGLYGYLFDLPVDYDNTDVSDIGDIVMYLMKKRDMIKKQCLNILKRYLRY